MKNNNIYQIRRIILDQSFRAHVGHIGSSLSIADIIAVLYTDILHIPSPKDPERDRFILSKGHAALALYAALSLRGFISAEQLNSYCDEDSLLGVHPEHALPGVDFSTGSLGHGLSYGAGVAIAARLHKSNRRAFVLASDAECNEGSMWETAMFAAHHHLANLIAIVDVNRQQALGYTKDVMNLSLLHLWQACNWDVHEIDGHNPAEIKNTIMSLNTGEGQPHVLLAHTIFGKGVSFMENQIKWHYWPMSECEYQKAIQEIGTLI